MDIRFQSIFPNERGVEITIDIFDSEYTGDPIPFNTDSTGYKISYAETGSEQIPQFMSTQCEILMWIENETQFELVADFSASQEGRFLVRIKEDGNLHWTGVVLPDVTTYDEVDFPIRFTIKAVDGVGALKDVPFKTAADEFYTGKATIAEFIARALSRIVYVSEFYAAINTFLRSSVDWWEASMDHDSSGVDMLGQAYLDNAVYYTYKDGTQGVLSCYDVLKDILTSLECRLTYARGAFHIEQLSYRIGDVIIQRVYDTDGVFHTANNYNSPNDIDQTAAGALLATGQYEFTAPISKAEHRFAALERRNFFAGLPAINETNVSLHTFYVPINSAGGATTLRLTGSLVLRISSNISEPGYTAPLNPFVAVIRMNFTLDTPNESLQRTYTLLPTYQYVYAQIVWNPTPGFYILQPIGGVFSANTTDDVFTFTQQVDVITPPLPGNTDTFSLSFTLESLKYYDGTTVPDWATDFDVTFDFSNPWLEAYSNGGPVLSGDGDVFYTKNPETQNTLVWKTEGLIGSSTNPNTVGAIWVKPGADYELATLWGVGAETPVWQYIGQVLTRAIAATHSKPARKLNGTLYGDVVALSRVVWQGENWMLLGGSWNSANNLFSGTWLEMKEVTGITPSSPIKFVAWPDPNPPTTQTDTPGFDGPFRISAPHGSVWYAIASTLTNENLRAGTPGGINIQDTLSDYDFNSGDQIAIINPLTGVFETLEITTTTNNGETALAVTGDLLNDYPVGSPIVRIPRIGGPFTLPGGVEGDIMRHNGTKWAAYHGTTDGHYLKWTAASKSHFAALPALVVSDGNKGDITVSSTGTVWTINNGVVTLAKMANMATASFLGRNTALTGVPEVLSIATAKTMLGLTGTNSGDQTITLTGDVTGSGTGSFVTAIGANKVTVGMLAQLAGLSILARASNSTGNVAALTASVALSYLRLNAAGTSLEWGTLPAGPTGSGASGQIAYWTGASTQDGDVSFLYDVTTFRMQINGTGSAVTPTAHYDLRIGTVSGNIPAMHLQGGISNDWTATLYNTRAAAAAANAIWEAKVAATSSGDPFFRAIVTGGKTWSFGVDNSDADKFKLRPQVDLGTGATGGEGLTITADVTPLVGINTDTPAHPLDVNGLGRALTFTNRTDATGGTSTFSTGAGGSPSLTSLACPNGNMMTVRFTSGSSPAAGARIINIVPPAAVRHANKIYPILGGYNDVTQRDIAKFVIDTSATTPANIAIKSNSLLSGIDAATDYFLCIHIMGHA